MAVPGPFYDEMPGPERRDTLNQMWADWLAALETAVGKDGWSPLLRTVADGERQVIELYDWTGGTTSKPSTGFMGAAGLVATAAEAVDFRGPPGPEGDAGPANQLGVGTVATGNPGTSVLVTITGVYPDQKINITIPRGDKGDTGDTPTVTVGTVTTGAPGSDVIITPRGTPTALILDFVIPRGDTGASGAGTGDVIGPAGAVDLQLAQFDGPTGKLIRNINLTGILAVDNGRPYVAQPGTDYVTPSGTVANATAAQTAVQLSTSRNINGVPFNGTQNITIPQNYIDLPSVTDLDALTTPGFYFCATSATSLTILNKPPGVNIAFGVEVRPTGGVAASTKRVEQVLKAYNGTTNLPTWIRSGDNGAAGAGVPAAWSGWGVRYDTNNPMPLKTINGQEVAGTGNLIIESGAGIDKLAYANRGNLRTLVGEYAMVDMLGLFEFEAGSVLTDDDESVFATATGRWILRCPSFDLLEAWNLPRANTLPGRVINGWLNFTAVSVAASSYITITANIPGVEVGDTVLITPPGLLGASAGSVSAFDFQAYCLSAGVVTLVITNAATSVNTFNTKLVGLWPVLVVKAN